MNISSWERNAERRESPLAWIERGIAFLKKKKGKKTNKQNEKKQNDPWHHEEGEEKKNLRHDDLGLK